MKRKVRIKKKPVLRQGGNTQGFYNDSTHNSMGDVNEYSTPDIEVNRTLKPVDEKDANIVAELNEFVTTPGAGGIPNNFRVGGKRHAQGGAPLNLQEDSFIFSDFKKGMKIKDPEILAQFGMSIPKKGKTKGYTPAEIAKKFDVNPFLKTLMDSKSDHLDIESAELSIKNNILKQGKLALVQESMKGFPQGIPKIAEPYLESIGMSSEDILPQEGPDAGQPQMAALGAELQGYNYGGAFDYAFGGSVNKAQAKKFPGLSIAKDGGELERAQLGKFIRKADKFKDRAIDKINKKFGRQESDIRIPISNMNAGDPRFVSSASFTDGNNNTTTSTRTTKAYNVPDEYKNDPRYDVSSGEYDPTLQVVGGYKKEADGKWRKVTASKTGFKGASQSGAANYKPKYGSIEEDAKRAKAILDKTKGVSFPKSGKYANSYVIGRDAAKNLSLEDKDFLTKVFSYGSESGGLGAPGIEIGLQNSGGTAFYGFVDPELIEYRHWKADNPTGTTAEYSNLSAEDKKANRTSYLKDLKYSPEQIAKFEKSGALSDPSKLYTTDFMKGDKTTPGFTARNQALFHPDEAGEFRPSQGNDYMFGLEHVDDYRRSDELTYEDAELIEQQEQLEKGEIGDLAPEGPAPYYKQDAINMGNLLGQRYGLKKYPGPDYTADLTNRDVIYHDPARALAAGAEAAAMAFDNIKAFAGPQSTSRASDVMGKAMENAANTLGQYENKNVPIANEYLRDVAETANKQAIMNVQGNAKRVADWATLNQNYDNAKRVANRNLAEGAIQAEDNRWGAQSLNELFPQFQTRPEIGGGTFFTQGRPVIDNRSMAQSSGNGYLEKLESLKNIYGDKFSDDEYEKAIMYGSGSTTAAGSPYQGGDAWLRSGKRRARRS